MFKNNVHGGLSMNYIKLDYYKISRLIVSIALLLFLSLQTARSDEPVKVLIALHEKMLADLYGTWMDDEFLSKMGVAYEIDVVYSLSETKKALSGKEKKYKILIIDANFQDTSDGEGRALAEAEAIKNPELIYFITASSRKSLTGYELLSDINPRNYAEKNGFGLVVEKPDTLTKYGGKLTLLLPPHIVSQNLAVTQPITRLDILLVDDTELRARIYNELVRLLQGDYILNITESDGAIRGGILGGTKNPALDLLQHVHFNLVIANRDLKPVGSGQSIHDACEGLPSTAFLGYFDEKPGQKPTKPDSDSPFIPWNVLSPEFSKYLVGAFAQKGKTITVSLPFQKEEEDVLRDPKNELKILMIDDRGVERMQNKSKIATLLKTEHTNVEIVEVDNTRDAERELKSGNIDIVMANLFTGKDFGGVVSDKDLRSTDVRGMFDTLQTIANHHIPIILLAQTRDVEADILKGKVPVSRTLYVQNSLIELTGEDQDEIRKIAKERMSMKSQNLSQTKNGRFSDPNSCGHTFSTK